ncbi:hypothetical protein NSQ77_05165 [Oceanobacillus sp. FSL K6-2867]|uniref:hypothetical protein n=1 Tax=Oceanobacillus sp. FSL K6-2867 TaxID=2954748 RepID=UPI0030DD8DD7
MKCVKRFFYYDAALLILSLLLVGCSSGMKEESEAVLAESASTLEEPEEINGAEKSSQDEELEDTESLTEREKITTNTPSEAAAEDTSNDDSVATSESVKENRLSKYSSEEIEYARVWLQLGPDQEIDELNVLHIPAGEPLNPDDDTDVSYPEDVIQLSGSRIVDGSVTYSGNGDGTIDVYNVPSRWYGGFPPPDDIDKNEIIEQMENIIENTELVYIEPVTDEKIIDLIEVLSIH